MYSIILTWDAWSPWEPNADAETMVMLTLNTNSDSDTDAETILMLTQWLPMVKSTLTTEPASGSRQMSMMLANS